MAGFWLALVAPATLGAALGLIEGATAGWLELVVVVTRIALVVAQSVLVVLLFSGLMRTMLAGAQPDRLPVRSGHLGLGRETWWYLAWAAIAWAGLWQSFSSQTMSLTGPTLPLWSLPDRAATVAFALVLLTIPAGVALVLVGPLLAGERRTAHTALAEDIRLITTGVRLRHLPAALVAVGATIVAFAGPVAMPRTIDVLPHDWPQATIGFLAPLTIRRASLPALPH